MKVSVLDDHKRAYYDHFQVVLFEKWKEEFHKSDVFCMVRNCGQRRDLSVVIVKNEDQKLSAVPMCRHHASQDTLLELEPYAELLDVSKIWDK